MKKETQKRSKKVRTGDTVLVIAGNAKGQKGKVLSCRQDKVLVQGINLCKRHVKRSQQNPKGGIVEFERPIHISNVQLCDENGNRVKAKIQFDAETGEKQLVSHRDGATVVVRSVKLSKE